MLSSPGLEAYKLREVVKACYYCPPIADEDLPTYQSHILEKSGDDAGGAADLGTAIHASIERYYSDRESWIPDDPIVMPNGQTVPCGEFVLPAASRIACLGLKVLHAEKTLVNAAQGYAGTTDIIFSKDEQHGILDFKSKRTKPGEKVEPIETHPVQIAAYVAAFWGREVPIPRECLGYNMYLSTTEVGRVEVVEYDFVELNRAWEIFEHCLAIYRWRNFDARRP
jgi:hypothetical protein